MRKTTYLMLLFALFSCGEQVPSLKEKEVSPLADSSHPLITEYNWVSQITLNDIKAGFGSKKDILQSIGQPKKTYTPNYECGFLWEEGYESLAYEGLVITGSSKDGYLFEKVDFSQLSSSVVVRINGHIITRQTTIDDVFRMMNLTAEVKPGNDFEIHCRANNKADDVYIIYFDKVHKIQSMEYWSPC